jgi:D-alanyl-lipoteichoic acid acyltransferase DltB (MBOAT superfamily)
VADLRRLQWIQRYRATSLQDFWRRWHISLSTWLRDYLYIPLGGNRHGETKTYRNLMLTMLLGGLWHGANWTFVIWGAIHGAGLSVERAARSALGLADRDTQPLTSAGAWVRRIVIFHLVCLAWVFFREPSFGESLAFLSGLATFTWSPVYAMAARFLAVTCLMLFIVDLINEARDEEYVLEGALHTRRLAVGVAMMAIVTLFSANQLNAFIYFRF